jgi:hypothetical protein
MQRTLVKLSDRASLITPALLLCTAIDAHRLLKYASVPSKTGDSCVDLSLQGRFEPVRTAWFIYSQGFCNGLRTSHA